MRMARARCRSRRRTQREAIEDDIGDGDCVYVDVDEDVGGSKMKTETGKIDEMQTIQSTMNSEEQILTTCTDRRIVGGI